MNSIDIKQFRADVSKLKKAGLIPAKNSRGFSVSAKTARPEQLVHGKRLIDYVRDKDNRSILKGEAISIAKSTVKDTQGLKIKKPRGTAERVIVPVPQDSKVTIEKGNIVITHKPESGTGTISRTLLPRTDLNQYLKDAEKLPTLTGNQRYAFYFFGNKSHVVVKDASQLVEYLTRYDAIDIDSDGDAPRSRKNANAFRNLEIIKLDYTGLKSWEKDVNRSIKKSRQGGKRRKENRRMENIPEHKKAIIRAKKAAYMRAARAKKKGK